ncbi:MAG: ribosome biogenesis GTPase Der [Candidatus Magasanikbacteria bacterium]|nr:ribosome biogenesis GTPase Der [Candidatus Magasanikbacteria bacterium]
MPSPSKLHTDNLPVIVLLGRANVGKSTLFNTLAEEHKALVSSVAGTTRTNNEADLLWRGMYVHLIDTGGQDALENEPFAKGIIEQAEQAIKRADIMVLVVDAQDGLLPQERELARSMQKLSKKQGAELFLVANKVDNHRVEKKVEEENWQNLGIGDPLMVSAVSGRGVGDFLDHAYKLMKNRETQPKNKIELPRDDTISVSLIGKPNVGKSSLFNKLIGQDKVLVSDLAHTTREPHDTLVEYTEEDEQATPRTWFIKFVDTAGIRRKAKVSGLLEREGIQKSIETVEKSDIILLVLDGSEPISSQDLQLGGLVIRRNKSVIIVVNKWDLAAETNDAERKKVTNMVRSYFPHLDFAPIMFSSGKTGYRIHKLFPLLIEVAQARKTVISNHAVEAFMERITHAHKPSRGKGTRQPKLLGFKQVHANPPIFELFIKHGTSLHRSYLNFIERKLREEHNFIGAPIVIKMTKIKK